MLLESITHVPSNTHRAKRLEGRKLYPNLYMGFVNDYISGISILFSHCTFLVFYRFSMMNTHYTKTKALFALVTKNIVNLQKVIRSNLINSQMALGIWPTLLSGDLVTDFRRIILETRPAYFHFKANFLFFTLLLPFSL